MVDKQNPKKYTVHMIGNAHIDPVWLWRLDEGRQEVMDSCRSALDRMKETPGFIFCRSSAATYLWIEEDDPEMFEEICQRVKEGRWHIVNGWWEQPDCNIPGGESYVRHGLYGKEYFREKFGVDVTAGYNVDTFGHNGMLPQILKKTGFTSYSFFRPEPGREKPGLPGVFWWQSPDGSRVVASRPPHYYAFGGDTKQLQERIMGAWEQTPDGLNHVMCFYGVGNHGGGPTKINIESILEAQDDPEMPNVMFSTPDTFFEAVQEGDPELPLVAEELQIHAVGCYSVVTAVKAFNRRCEQELLAAERYATLANLLYDLPVPADDLRDSWRDVLFNQFHDILAGTSITPAYEDVYNMYGRALEVADTTKRSSLRKLAHHVDTRGEGLAVTVFNPSPWERRDFVTCDVEVAVEAHQVRMTDSQGNEIPTHIVSSEVGGDRGVVTVGFVADVPAHGYAVYRAILDTLPQVASTTLRVGADWIGNEFLTVKADPRSGAVTSIALTDGTELVGEGGVRLDVLKDTSDTWSHGVTRYDEVLGSFLANGSVRVVERGPVRATLEIDGSFNGSTSKVVLAVYPGIARVDGELNVDFDERHRMLKLAVPVNVEAPKAVYDIPYGFLERPTDGAEMPGQKWLDVSGKAGTQQAGLTLLNADRYGFDVNGPEMHMSVLRTPIYAFHDPRQVLAKERYHYVDLGEGRCRFSLVPHKGDWRAANAPREGEAFNSPMTAFIEPFHGGSLEKSGAPLLDVGPENVIGTVLKMSQDGGKLIVRLYETFGRDGTAAVKLPQLGIDAEVPLAHHEIRTLAFDPSNPDAGPVETDMLEQPVA